MGVSFKELSTHIKQEEEKFGLVNKVKYIHNGIEVEAETYTLIKLNSKIERKLIDLYTASMEEHNNRRKQITVADLLSSAIIKINNKKIESTEAIDFIDSLDYKEVELLFYNLRIMNYGNSLVYSYACQGETVAKAPNGRVERDIDGSVVMKTCNHLNTVDITLDGVDEVTVTEESFHEFNLSDYIDIDIDVKIFAKKVSGKEKDSKLYRSIPIVAQKKYGYLFDFIVAIDRIEIITEDDVEIKRIEIEDFFNKKGVFTPDTVKIKDFRHFYDNILNTAIIRDIKNKSNEMTEMDSYIDISFEHKCKACGFVNKGKVGVYHPNFLLPTSAK